MLERWIKKNRWRWRDKKLSINSKVLVPSLAVFLVIMISVMVSCRQQGPVKPAGPVETQETDAGTKEVVAETLEESTEESSGAEETAGSEETSQEETTAEPTEENTAEPTEESTAEPTEESTAEPTEESTAEPTEESATEPTEESVTGSAKENAAETEESGEHALASSKDGTEESVTETLPEVVELDMVDAVLNNFNKYKEDLEENGTKESAGKSDAEVIDLHVDHNAPQGLKGSTSSLKRKKAPKPAQGSDETKRSEETSSGETKSTSGTKSPDETKSTSGTKSSGETKSTSGTKSSGETKSTSGTKSSGETKSTSGTKSSGETKSTSGTKSSTEANRSTAAQTSAPSQSGSAAATQGPAAQEGTSEPISEAVRASIQGLKAGTVVSKENISKYGVSEYFTVSPISDEVFARIYGKSYKEDCTVPLSDLRYVKVLHYGVNDKIYVGEIISHKDISICLQKIFKELYDKKYPIEKMRLVDDYDADDLASAADNNTSCFNFRETSGNGSTLSRHAYGKAIDINPLYNPYTWVDENGTLHCQPQEGVPYLDRSKDSAYKVEKDDLCYQLFIEHGFSWGGEWGNEKDYMHFSVP